MTTPENAKLISSILDRALRNIPCGVHSTAYEAVAAVADYFTTLGQGNELVDAMVQLEESLGDLVDEGVCFSCGTDANMEHHSTCLIS